MVIRWKVANMYVHITWTVDYVYIYFYVDYIVYVVYIYVRSFENPRIFPIFNKIFIFGIDYLV